MMKETLFETLRPFGPSGSEDAVRAALAEMARPYADEIFADALGNLICARHGAPGGKRVMLSAHMDTIGMMVVAAEKEGFLRVTNIGGIRAAEAAGREVVFANGKKGVVCAQPLGEDKPAMNKLFVDVGAQSAEEALEIAPIGSVCALPFRVVEMGECVSGPYMDNRSACAVLVELLRALGKTKDEIFFVFSAQEEVGARGAQAAAYALSPDIGIAVDVTMAGGTPKADPPLAVRLGKGPAVKIMDHMSISTPSVRDGLIDAAKAAGVPFQYEVLPFGGTDAGVIMVSRGGVPSATLSIPCRYVHSPVETVNLTDMEQCVALLKTYLETLA